jgi:hypothetical protein
MVGDEAVGWNPLLFSLINFAVELEEHGFVYHDSIVGYFETS